MASNEPELPQLRESFGPVAFADAPRKNTTAHAGTVLHMRETFPTARRGVVIAQGHCVTIGGNAGATFAIALGCAVSMSAQAGSTTSSSQTPSASRPITVTGCLQGGSSTSGATGTSGTAGAAASGARSGGQFMLTNARAASSSSTASSGAGATSPGTTSSSPGTGAGAPGGAASTAGTAGSSSSSSVPMSGSTYILEGSDLSQHNGHQVEITGTLAAASSTGSTSGAGSTTTAGI